MNPNYLKNKRLALQNQAVAPMAASDGMSGLEKPEGLNRDITAKNFGRDARTVVDSLVGGPLSVVKDAFMIAPNLRRAATDFVGDSASDIYDGFTGTDSTVNNPEAAVSPVEDDPLDTGTDQLDSYNELTGAMTNGNGDDITPTDDDKNQAKGIFDKASDLFGDIASASDLRRMTLYTVGGLMTGGSLGGSFKWAGMRVMEEQQLNKKNNAVVSAAKIKASKDHGKRTGNNSFGINVEGIDGLTHIESYEIGSSGGDINVVDVPDPSNPGQTKRMTVDNFRNWVKSKGGSSAKGSNEKNMPSTKAARVYQVTGELSGIMDEVFANNEGMTSVSGKESVASYFSNRNYDLSSESELVNLKHITALGAEEAAANFRGNGKQIQDMAPYFDKSALSVEAGVPGDGVWGMMTDPFLSDPTPINGVTMDPKKIAVLVSTMKGMAGESGFEGVKKNFKILHKEYMTLKAADKIPAMELNPGENEFYTWVTKELKKPL